MAHPGDPDKNDPFGNDPFEGGAAGTGSGGLLDDLRSSGEAAVNDEIAGLQQAMERVESFAATVADADLDALRSEWQQIESELKRALQSGLAAVEERTTVRHPAAVDDEVRALEAEIARKNELVAQLTDTVKRLSSDLDERDRRSREEMRSLRDRVAQQDEELTTLRSRSGDLDHALSRLRTQHEAASSERDELRVSGAKVADALEAEKAHQEERYAAIQAELNAARLSHSGLENAKRDVERRAQDLERRLQAAEKAREKIEAERAGTEREASRASTEAKSLAERVTALDAEVASQRERIDKDVRRLKRTESRLRMDGETFRSRLADVKKALQGAVGLLDGLPAELPADDEPTPEE